MGKRKWRAFTKEVEPETVRLGARELDLTETTERWQLNPSLGNRGKSNAI
jgi:hypothetical protein